MGTDTNSEGGWGGKSKQMSANTQWEGDGKSKQVGLDTQRVQIRNAGIKLAVQLGEGGK